MAHRQGSFATSRRDFITLFGGVAATWPLGARAQRPAMPVIGLLNGVSFEAYADRVAAFRQGLNATGFVEGQNVAIEYRSADGRPERLPALAADLVRRQVAVIVAIGTDLPTIAAKAATSTIPIIFASGGDALDSGLVASLARPEANVTGVSFNNTTLEPKRLELMSELLPGGTLIGFLGSSGLSTSARPDENPDVRQLVAAARTIGRRIVVLDASTEQAIDAAFATIVEQRVAALMVSSAAFLNSRRDQIIALAARHAIPTIYANREYVRAGGLMSYGVELYDLYRWAGIYAGRILKGAKPGDLPVMQPTKFEFVINVKTARALGIDIPLALLIRVDESIE